MADYKIDDTVDITDVVCPVTFVKAKVALEELDDGQILAVRMNNGEPVQNVPRSIKEEGHQILKLTDNGDDTENFEEKVLKADKPVLVDFYSDSCIPCKQMAGILGDIEDENEDDIYIYKVNVNYDRELAEKYKVMSVPTVICFVNGEAKGKTVGLKEQEEIEELFEKYV